MGALTRFRYLNQEKLAMLRAGDRASEADLLRDCKTFAAARYRGGLKEEDLEDVASGAVSDALPLIRSGASLYDVSKEIYQSIDRQRQKIKRDQKRERERRVEPSVPLADSRVDSETRVGALDLAGRLVKAIEPEMEGAFLALSDRDQVLLGMEYGLPTTVQSPKLIPTSPEAKKKALQRARARFNGHLERQLEARQREGALHPDVITPALLVVRGNKLHEVLRLLEEF